MKHELLVRINICVPLRHVNCQTNFEEENSNCSDTLRHKLCKFTSIFFKNITVLFHNFHTLHHRNCHHFHINGIIKENGLIKWEICCIYLMVKFLLISDNLVRFISWCSKSKNYSSGFHLANDRTCQQSSPALFLYSFSAVFVGNVKFI